MDDKELGRLVARDLDGYLADAGSWVEGPVYAISLWADEAYGDFGIMLATQASFERRWQSLIERGVVSSEEASGPALRWYSGDWEMQPEQFLSSPTRTALQPLADMLNDMSIDYQAQLPLWRRWRKIAYTVVGQLRPPAGLPLTSDALWYVELPNTTHAEAADVMLRTVVPGRLHEAIPAWRLLAETVRAVRADPARLAHVRHQAEEAAAGRHRFPLTMQPASDVLTARLRSCGLRWHDVASGSKQLELALAIADRD